MRYTAYIVICREDRPLPRLINGAWKHSRRKGAYSLATRQVFPTVDSATAYAKTCNPSREPLVVGGRFDQLRGGRIVCSNQLATSEEVV